MAALTTSVGKIGVNGVTVLASGGLTTMSTATTKVTLTIGSLGDVVLFAYNPSGADNVTLTVSSTQTASRYAGKGIGDYTLTTSLNSSCYAFFGNLESARFKSTANTIIVTATTTILIAAIEVTSTRCI